MSEKAWIYDHSEPKLDILRQERNSSFCLFGVNLAQPLTRLDPTVASVARFAEITGMMGG